MTVTIRALAVAVMCCLTSAAGAQEANGLTFVPLGYQQITSLSSATKLTVPAGATRAVISVEGQDVRYRDDGTAPTAGVGMPIATGATITYVSRLSALQFIEQSASAKLDVLYYR